MKTRELWFRAALVLVSSLGTLAACEVGLRAYLSMSDSGAEALASLSDAPETAAKVDVGTTGLRGLVRPSRDPELVYELRPNIAGRFKGRPFSISAQGLRDREYPQAKPPEVYRVIGLGDSVAFGWGVPQEASYLEVLERRWTEVGRAIEVLNFAVPGYNTAMEVAAFERKALAFDPDLVLLHFVENDLRLPSFLQPPRKIWTSRTSHLWKLLSERPGLPGPGPAAEPGGLQERAGRRRLGDARALSPDGRLGRVPASDRAAGFLDRAGHPGDRRDAGTGGRALGRSATAG